MALFDIFANLYTPNQVRNQFCFKDDCYWYTEEQDMNARIPFCNAKSQIDPLNPGECYDCPFYHSKHRPINADMVRAMNDEELEKWFWWMLEYTRGYTDSRIALHDWLRKECKPDA